MNRGRFAVGALAVAIFAIAASTPEVAKKGDHPKYTFGSGLVNGDGVKTLADLAGRPVLVEFWGWH